MLFFAGIVFWSTMQGFDESLRPFIPFKAADEFTEKSLEITEKFKRTNRNAINFPFKAFEIFCKNEVDSILITNPEKTKTFGSLVYLFFNSSIEKNDQHNPAYIYITNIKITRQLRGNGLGSALFNYVLHKQHPEKISYIELASAASDYEYEKIPHAKARERLNNFYKNLGMVKKIGTVNQYILHLDTTKKIKGAP